MRVIYEDNHVIVVTKEPGVPTQPDGSGRTSLLEEAKAYVKRRYAKPGDAFLGLVHRLDRPAAGLVVFARTSKSAGRLSKEIRERRMEKTYRALVEGTPELPRGSLAHWLVREGTRTVVAPAGSAERAREARLDYRVLRSGAAVSLVEIHLLTGRKHQIRAQFASRGHPILGDRKYGATMPYRPGAIALFACGLAFLHPTRKERLAFAAEIPDDWSHWA